MGDATDDIVAATYRALCEHGYADLTMQDIADESEKSKSLLHYHYDSKHDLLCAFLDDLHDDFVDRIDGVDGGDPEAFLRALYDDLTTPRDEESFPAFQTALMELKAQAPYDDDIRERILEFDRHLEEQVRQRVAEGIDDGAVAGDVDPDAVARFVVTLVLGAQTRHVTTGEGQPTVREELDAYIEARLRPAEVSA